MPTNVADPEGYGGAPPEQDIKHGWARCSGSVPMLLGAW